jgi:Ras-related protein Rab-6A
MTTICHKAVFVGDSAVGKTSILNQYLMSSCSPDHQPTIGIDFFSKFIQDGDKTIRLQMWDTAGQEKFHSLIPSYLRNSTVAVLVYDLTHRSSFENLHKWHQTITNASNAVLIVVGNKLDLEVERTVSAEEGQRFATTVGAEFIETSARIPLNIDQLFEKVVGSPVPVSDEYKKPEGEADQTIVVTVDVAQPRDPSPQACGC